MDDLTSELWTALILEQYHLMNRLIYRGANVNEQMYTRFDPVSTMLHYAAVMGDVQGVHLLINHGANCNARDSQAQAPLHWAVMANDRPDVVEVLINGGAVVDARDCYQSTPLHFSVGKHFNESAQKLIARGASVEAVDEEGRSILHTAVIYQNLSMVKVLISHGVNLEAEDTDGCTPLIYALENTDIVQLLLENGADVNTKSRGCLFSLIRCDETEPPGFSLSLLIWGARVNEATNSDETALYVACREKCTEVAALLLQFGADLNARNCNEGKTPFELLPNRPFNKAIARVLIREAVKREALGQPLCEGYKQTVQSHESYSEFEQECREEIMRIQSEKIEIEDSVISFFQIFSMDKEKLARLARNEKIVTAFEASGYVASFTIYAGDLTFKFEMAKRRANFLMIVEDCLVDVLGDILPAPIVRNIAAMSSPAIYNRK